MIGDLIAMRPLKIRPVSQKVSFGIRSKWTKEECPITFGEYINRHIKLVCLDCGQGYDKYRLFCECGAGMSQFMGHPYCDSKAIGEIPFPELLTAIGKRQRSTHFGDWHVRLKHEYVIFARDKKCLHCGTEIAKWLVYEYKDTNNGGDRKRRVLPIDANFVPITIDHIIPVSKGGPSSLDNFQTLCWNCNNVKGSDIPAHIDDPEYFAKERTRIMQAYREFVGKKVRKKSGKPFKSGSKVNTVKHLVSHLETSKTGFAFLEDDSVVEAWRCEGM